MKQFEDKVREWTKPVNGQYPRPWMSDLTDPTTATTFIVGRNQATPFPVEFVGTHEQFLDALFNRNGQTHAALYQRVRARMGKGSSPTRGNIERLTAVLRAHGVTGVLETNVICYSTPMSADLANAAHRGGKETGTQIFSSLLRTIKPRVVITHGEGARSDLERILGTSLPAAPQSPEEELSEKEVTPFSWGTDTAVLVVVIPALAPPAWNRWSRWASGHFEAVARRTANFLA
jgi:hypothetical protein